MSGMGKLQTYIDVLEASMLKEWGDTFRFVTRNGPELDQLTVSAVHNCTSWYAQCTWYIEEIERGNVYPFDEVESMVKGIRTFLARLNAPTPGDENGRELAFSFPEEP